VRDPELPDGAIAMGEREAVVGLGMGEECRVEVEPDAERPRPVGPRGEVLGPDGVAVHELAAEVAVEGVQVEAMLPRDQRERALGVRAQLVRRARLAGVVAGCGEAATETRPELLEPADVVALPAVE
jgi:hypothetical protein